MKKFIFSKESWLYLFYGVLTTVVNYVAFYLFYSVLFHQKASVVANVIAFIFAVTFAYITNKLFVFESKSWDISVLRQEIPQFFGARLLSFLFEELGLLICDNMLGLGRYHLFSIWKISVDGVLLSKVILSVFVVIINYFFCKFLIFKKK